MRVVVITGSRKWTDRAAIERAMAGAELLIVGDCPTGADALALAIAFEWDIFPIVFAASKKRAAELATLWKRTNQRAAIRTPAADWEVHGKHAGPMRNREIAATAHLERASGMDVVCYAFPLPDSVGTVDCMSQLRAAGFTVTLPEAAGS